MEACKGGVKLLQHRATRPHPPTTPSQPLPAQVVLAPWRCTVIQCSIKITHSRLFLTQSGIGCVEEEENFIPELRVSCYILRQKDVVAAIPSTTPSSSSSTPASPPHLHSPA
ncbi:hypothetical protein Pcinc_001398 [Petrolisthes cinctipes]|uniref:Uncharacterized protein n=1 Tax=Petrolisthes cinctipes TaxID=88211 RepID=A0AAE1GND9_PETCI|nr:hypothetical protein Pcinc_001398 [Petrolisthes cinctipes]